MKAQHLSISVCQSFADEIPALLTQLPQNDPNIVGVNKYNLEMLHHIGPQEKQCN
jgi:hypothetical protein